MDIIQIPTTQTPGAGLGDVVGPASSTDNAIVRYDTTTGRLLQNSTVTIADSTGAIAGASSLTSPASTDLTLGTGTSGAAITVLSADNNVGIGTASPSSTLTVATVDTLLKPALGLRQANALGYGYDFDTETASVGRLDLYRVSNNVRTQMMSWRQDTGNVSISSTTAGASNAGALVVAGGISAGQSAQASYFGGSISFPSDTGIISSVNNGRLFLDGSANGSGGSIILYGSAAAFPAQTVYTAATHVYKNISGTQQLSLSLTAATFAGAVSVATGAAVGGATAGAGGLAFPATAVAVADANTLDDYEEGTWTPTFAGSTTSPTVTYAAQSGSYTKIGRQVTVSFEVGTSAQSLGVGSVQIAGLPFTIGVRVYSAVATFNINNPVTGPMAIFAEVNAGGSNFGLLATGDNTSWSGVSWTDALSASIYVNGSFTYFV